MIKFEELYEKVRQDHKMPENILCLDPGETTGWAQFKNHHLVRWGHIVTVQDDEIQWQNILKLFEDIHPDYVVCEDYRVYAHKLERHTFSQVPTLRLIGGISLICYVRDVPIHYQMALTAKGFATDEKLKYWGFWQEGMRHARDAIRHGIYFLLFYKKGEDVIEQDKSN